jgi:nicotinamidase-related amidase
VTGSPPLNKTVACRVIPLRTPATCPYRPYSRLAEDQLCNLGVRSLIVAWMMTDQCVGSAVRDACDLGYLATLVTDGCITASAERHEQSLIGIRGYCRQRRTDELLVEIAALTGSR